MAAAFGNAVFGNVVKTECLPQRCHHESNLKLAIAWGDPPRTRSRKFRLLKAAWQFAENNDFRSAIFHHGQATLLAADQFPSAYNFRGFDVFASSPSFHGVFATPYSKAYTGQLHNKIDPLVWQEKRGGRDKLFAEESSAMG